MMLGAAAGLLGAYLVVNLLGIYLTGPHAWDDGAITLAFARTLAEHGRFALTGVSDTVEGSSSLLFALLMASLHRLFGFSFERFIFASQAVAFVATSAMMLFAYRGLRPAIEERAPRLLAVALLATLPMFTAEIYNGMEMSLFALLTVLAASAYQRNSRTLYLLLPLLLLTRFEAVFYLATAFALLCLARRDERPRAAAWLLYTLLAFALITALRWLYFGELVPNPILAKLNPPYSPVDAFALLRQKGEGALEFIDVNFFLLLFAGALWFLRDAPGRRIDFKAALVIAFGLFAALAGKNWGYEGRMFLACLPLLLLIIGDTFSRMRTDAHTQLVFPTRTIVFRNSALCGGLLCTALLLTHVANLPLAGKNLKTALSGGYDQGRLFDPLHAWVGQRVAAQREPNDFVTPDYYRRTGLAIEKMRALLALESVRFMTPDVGGLSLCCDRIRVIDSALLTNRAVARSGYAGFGRHLEQTRPDVIETHGLWTEVSGIHQSAFFRRHYTPIVFADNLLWVRNDHVGRLTASPRVQSAPVADLEALAKVRYGTYAIDLRYLRDGNHDVIWEMQPE